MSVEFCASCQQQDIFSLHSSESEATTSLHRALTQRQSPAWLWLSYRSEKVVFSARQQLLLCQDCTNHEANAALSQKPGVHSSLVLLLRKWATKKTCVQHNTWCYRPAVSLACSDSVDDRKSPWRRVSPKKFQRASSKHCFTHSRLQLKLMGLTVHIGLNVKIILKLP